MSASASASTGQIRGQGRGQTRDRRRARPEGGGAARTVGLCVLVLAAGLAAQGADSLRVECDGPVEWMAGPAGAGRIVLSGGVRVEYGETKIRSQRAEVLFVEGAEGPARILAEGDVRVVSPELSASADAAEIRRVAPEKASPGEALSEENGPAAAGSRAYVITLERRESRAVELRSGAVSLVCGGPVTYDARSREVRIAGRLRAETENMVVRADSALLVLSKAGLPPGPDGDDDEPGARMPPGDERESRRAFERIELDGAVEIRTRPGEGAARQATSGHAVYFAAEDVLVLTGDPAPEVRSIGVTLTAPEIRLYVTENRIESPRGDLRAIVTPAAKGRSGTGEGE